MIKILGPISLCLSIAVCISCSDKKLIETQNPSGVQASVDLLNSNADSVIVPIIKSPEEWKKQLTPEQFHVLRNKGTERAFTGPNWDNHESGNYYCAGCNLLLFSSKTKFDSGTGWPSFFQPIQKNGVKEISDSAYGMTRVEIVCARCDGHLGHVFEDGPAPTGLRYCMNGTSLNFIKSN